MFSSWKKWFAQEQWTIGLVDQSLEDIVNKGIIKPIQWLPALKNGFLADPHASILPDGRVEILAERFDFERFKGEIVCATTPLQEVEAAHFKPAVDLATHLSYPQRISWEKEDFLFCEGWKAMESPFFPAPILVNLGDIKLRYFKVRWRLIQAHFSMKAFGICFIPYKTIALINT